MAIARWRSAIKSLLASDDFLTAPRENTLKRLAPIEAPYSVVSWFNKYSLSEYPYVALNFILGI